MNPAVQIDNLGIPPLAGVCSYERAAEPGLDIDSTVRRLQRCNYVIRRLHEVAAAHLARTPEWEVKCALGFHLWLDAEHSAAIRARVAEMRKPPHRLDEVPDERLRATCEELLRAQDTVELVAGAYGAVRPAVADAIADHLEQLNPLFDYPTARMLRMILQEQQTMLDWGRQALTGLVRDANAADRARAFQAHLEQFLAAAGGIADAATDASPATPPMPRWDGSDYILDSTPRRDARFVEPLNGSATIDDYYADEMRPSDERTYALAYKRLREMDVPEWMAPIIFATRDKPWEYYRDLSRQLWDETRHAMMGEVGLYVLGIPFYTYPVDMSASLVVNHEFTPLEAHLVLWYIEQGLMPRQTGKQWEWKIAAESGDPFFAALRDYDWADEVLHARIGRRWLAEDVPDADRRRTLGGDVSDRLTRAIDRSRQGVAQTEWWPEFIARARAARIMRNGSCRS